MTNCFRLAFSFTFLRCGLSYTCLWILLWVWTAQCVAGPRKTLFLDPEILEKASNTTLEVHPPRQAEVVISADKPWESLMISFYSTVREENGKLRLWYICRDRENKANLAYAESVDGVAWTKPNLGIVDYHGSTDNNLVGISSLDGTVSIDPNAKTPNEKYVYITRGSKSGLVRYLSADGLHWKSDATPLLPFGSDTQNVVLWDPHLNQWVLYLRRWAPRAGSDKLWRSVVRLTAEDLSSPLPIAPSGKGMVHRGSPFVSDEIPTVLETDGSDRPEADIYNIAAQLYPGDDRWYIGFPSFLFRQAHPTKKDVENWGRVEAYVVGSRDGISWNRYDRKPYVALKEEGKDNPNVIFLATGMILRGDEIWQYGVNLLSKHGDVESRKKNTDGRICRYVQRLDGFVSLSFGPAEGSCLTRSTRIDGKHLFINVDIATKGVIRVGLVDGNEKPVAGFGIDDCIAIQASGTRVKVSWKGGNDLSFIQGKEVRVSISGQQAKLYSFYYDGEATNPR